MLGHACCLNAIQKVLLVKMINCKRVPHTAYMEIPRPDFGVVDLSTKLLDRLP